MAYEAVATYCIYLNYENLAEKTNKNDSKKKHTPHDLVRTGWGLNVFV